LPRHTFLYAEGVWLARGVYLDATGRRLPAAGETRVSHGADGWVGDGWIRLEGSPPVELRNRYEIIPFPAGSEVTTWTCGEPGLGRLHGRFAVVGDSILSTWRNEDGSHTGVECLTRLSDRRYRARGAAFRGDQRLSAWRVELTRARRRPSGRRKPRRPSPPDGPAPGAPARAPRGR
jgi:hypothetical protein